MSPRGRFEPAPSAAGAPFWEATREHRLLLPWCTACGLPHWFPRANCPHCRSSAIEWRPAAGDGEVYALCVEHRATLPGVFGSEPFVVALVELGEGVRLMTNVVNAPAAEVKVGMAVSLVWEELSDGRRLPLFEPAGAPEPRRVRS